MGNINTVPLGSADVMVSMIDELNQQAWKIHISEPKKALELSASAKKLSEENNYRKGLAYAIRNMGVSNRYLSNLEIALSLSVQALDLFVEMGDMSGEAQSCVSIGAIYYYIGDYVRSTDYLLKGLKLSEEVGNKELQAYAYNGVGYNYGIMGDIKKGLEYLHKALELSKAVEVDHDLQPRVLDSMAETYLNDGQMDKAFECYNESLQLCEKSGHKLMKSQVFLGIGNIFVMQKRYTEAGEYFIKSLEICGEISYQVGEADSLLFLGKLFLQQDNSIVAKQYLKDALKVAEVIKAKGLIYQIHEALSELFEKEKDITSFIKHFKLYHKLKSEVFMEEQETKQKYLAIQFDMEKLQREAEINRLTNVVMREKNIELEQKTEELEQRNAELAVITSVQEGLAKELDMQGIYELVGEKIREIFNAQVFDIVTYDKATNLIEDRYAYEKGDRTPLPPRPLNGFRKHVIKTGQPLVINSEMEKRMRDLGNIVLTGEASKSCVFVPMIVGEEATGIISLQNVEEENAFSNSDVRLLTTLVNSMTVALENARLFDETTRLLKETEQRTAELSVINSVQDSLAKELDIKGVYELVGEKMRNIFNAQVIDIVTYNKSTNLIVDCYSYEKGDTTLLGPREPKGFRKHVIETAKTLLINKDVNLLSLMYDNVVLVGEMAKSLVLVPMIAGDEVTGVISLQNLDQENAFSDADVSLLTTLSNSMSVALENARLFDETSRLLKETEQRTAELSVINSVQEGLAKELDIRGIYELVGEKMREIFKAQVIDIVAYNKTTNLIEDCYAFEKGDRTLLGPREPIGYRKYIIKTGKFLVINQDYDIISLQYENKTLIGDMPKSAVFVPMVSGGNVNGVISLQNLDIENAFSESDISLLTTLSNSMSVALENARLFDETNRLLKETEQRTAELSVINSVQEGLAKELDINGIYELVGEKIREIFKAQVIDIVTYNKSTNLIEDCYAFEKGDRTLLGPREPKGFRKHIIETAKTLVINKDVDLLKSKYDNTVIVGEAAKSVVFVPMIVSDEVTGVISLQNLDRENAFSNSDVNLLTTLSNSMSVALENARLFDETIRLLKETEQRTAELSVINSVQDGLAKEPDIKGIYELVGEKMREIFKAQVIDIVSYTKATNLIEDCYAFEKGDTSLLGAREPNGFRKHIIDTGQILVINDNFDKVSQQYSNVPMIGEQPKSAIFVPISSGTEVTGVISIQNIDHENVFSESDIKLLTTFSNSMSVALENARLFNETTRLLGETEQRASELQTVNHISRALVSQLEFDALIALVGDHMKDTFKADIVYLALYDRNTDMIHFPYFYGDTTKSRPFGNGITEKIIITKEPILINHNLEEVYDKIKAEKKGKVVESFMGVPIVVGQEAIGVISVQSTEKENRFTENDQRLLTTIAANVGIAMHNAEAYQKLQAALNELKEAQEQLVQQEKLASLGQLAAGIAHEIKNPLNFVNNFSEVNTELIDEMKAEIEKGNMEDVKLIANDIRDNQEKITHHGKRADAIVKSMLQHSRSSTGTKELADINALSDEYLRLSYHGLRAKDKSFNATMKTDFDSGIGKINIIPQDIGRVILNLITNAFYAVDEKKKQLGDGYEPTVSISTKKNNGMVEICVKDNGNGIPQSLINKIFQPFFTTKPTGQGTGLGLSLSYDIAKAHGGELLVETKEGEGTLFKIIIPE